MRQRRSLERNMIKPATRESSGCICGFGVPFVLKKGFYTGSPRKVLQQGFQGLGCKVHEGSTRLACEIRVPSGLLEVRVWV